MSSLADIGNLGSVNNIKLLGSLLRGDDLEDEYNYDDTQYYEYNEDSDNENE